MAHRDELTDATRIVTVPDNASPGERLLAFEQELRIEHPHLTAAHARHLVRQKHADLAQLDHLGLQEPEPATVDPGILIGAAVQKRLTDGRAINEAEAQDQVRAEHPDWVQAWSECRHLPAETVTTHQAAGPVRSHSDPGRELMARTAATMAAEGLDVDAARRAVLKRDPVLARHYSDATPLPMVQTRPTTQIDKLIADRLAAHVAMQADLAAIARMAGPGHDPLNPSGRRHYSTLSASERARHFPHARPLSRGEALRAGETLVEKMAAEDADGGSWAVRAVA